MPKQFVNPPTLHPARGYTHAVAVDSAKRMVFVAGQVAFDKDLQIVGAGDLRAQARQALQNLNAALTAAGAKLEDVVKINIYVVNYNPTTDLVAVGEVRREVFSGANPPASTMVGVQKLAVDGLLIEVEAIAVV